MTLTKKGKGYTMCLANTLNDIEEVMDAVLDEFYLCSVYDCMDVNFMYIAKDSGLYYIQVADLLGIIEQGKCLTIHYEAELIEALDFNSDDDIKFIQAFTNTSTLEAAVKVLRGN